MAQLKKFLESAKLGSLMLGQTPNEVIGWLGDAEQISRKSNPLQLKYGALQLVFWRPEKQRSQQLVDILILFQPNFESMPPSLKLDDFPRSAEGYTEQAFRRYIHLTDLTPANLEEGASSRRLSFLSGVDVFFTNGLLHSIRLTHKSDKEPPAQQSFGKQEPTVPQIEEMLVEAEEVMKVGAFRAALLIGWAAIEAAMRRVASSAGLQATRVQPSILIRELLASDKIRPEERDVLEKMRQLRTVAAHGLAPVNIDAETVLKVIQIGKRLVGNKGVMRRSLKELDYIWAVDAIEAYSILAKSKHYQSLAHYLQSRGLTVRIVLDAISGNDPQHDIQVKKDCAFSELLTVLSDWKNAMPSITW